MDPETLRRGKLLNWAEKRRGTFTYSDLDHAFPWPRELAVALVGQAVEMGAIEPVELGRWQRSGKRRRDVR